MCLILCLTLSMWFYSECAWRPFFKNYVLYERHNNEFERVPRTLAHWISYFWCKDFLCVCVRFNPFLNRSRVFVLVPRGSASVTRLCILGFQYGNEQPLRHGQLQKIAPAVHSGTFSPLWQMVTLCTVCATLAPFLVSCTSGP